MKIKDYRNTIYATDIVLAIYILISTILILLQYSNIYGASNHIIARVLMMVITFQIIYLHKNYSTPFMEFFHLLLPYFYIIYFYYEAPDLNFFHLQYWTQEIMSQVDLFFLGDSSSMVFLSLAQNHLLKQFSYFVQLIAYVSVPILVFIAYAKSNIIGKKFAFISFSTLLIFVFIMQLFPSDINTYENLYTGILGGIYELSQIIIYDTNVSSLNILVGFLIVSALFFINIDKRISLILSVLWLLSSFASIILNEQYFSSTIISWLISPMIFLLGNLVYKKILLSHNN